MAIKIVKDGPDLVMTSSEYLRALREYQRAVAFMVDPPTFEEWVRSQVASSPKGIHGNEDFSLAAAVSAALGSNKA